MTSPKVHGTNLAYKRGCRCMTCRAAHSEYRAQYRAEKKAQLAADPSAAEHGVYSTYANWMCRCDPCKAAAAKVKVETKDRELRPRAIQPQTRQRNGDVIDLLDNAKARRAYLLAPATEWCGWHEVADARPECLNPADYAGLCAGHHALKGTGLNRLRRIEEESA